MLALVPCSLRHVPCMWLWALDTFTGLPVVHTVSQDVATTSLWTWVVAVPGADTAQHLLASGGGWEADALPMPVGRDGWVRVPTLHYFHCPQSGHGVQVPVGALGSPPPPGPLLS